VDIMAFRVLTDFIQVDVIVALLRDKLEATTVARNVVDVKSNSALGKGSSYKIPGVGDLTVNQYDGTEITPEDATQTNEIVLMNKFPFINFFLEDSDVDEASALSIAAAWAQEAATRIAQDMDKAVFTGIAAGAIGDAALGVVGTPTVIADADDALAYVEAFAQTLREGNIADGSIVVPSFLGVKLVSAVGKLGNDALAGAIVPGFVGRLFGFDIFESNNLPVTAGTYTVVGGKKGTFHLVEGLTIVKSGDAQGKPATWNQMGQVYGADFSNENGWRKGFISK
jgi:hypothetical protein